jgi:Ca-activated chloride channel family protein
MLAKEKNTCGADKSIRRLKLNGKAKAWLISCGIHFILITAAAVLTICTLNKTDASSVCIQYETRQFSYDETLDRDTQKTPKIICDRIVEKPIIILEEETEITTDIPRGTSFENLSNKNLRSNSCVDAFGIGSGGAGAYGISSANGVSGSRGGALGSRSGCGNFKGTGKTPRKVLSAMPDKDMRQKNGRMKRKWVIVPENERKIWGDLVNVPDDSPEPEPPAETAKKDGNPAPEDMTFDPKKPNPVVDASEDEYSTFAVDVDTASFTLARKYLEGGHIPPPESVRVEEFVNYMEYNYDQPARDAFATHIEAAPNKFDNEGASKLLRIGLMGERIRDGFRKKAALTFVIDISYSMEDGNRLGMVKDALRLLLNELKQDDTVGIVVFASAARVVTQPLSITNREELLNAIDGLKPESATNADAGLYLGYQMAAENFEKSAINRVILCSDGGANVDETSPEGILQKIKQNADKGIYLSTVGFGMGGYNDTLMEKLADKGNGNYTYVDSLKEAERVFARDLTGTLQTIAKDVKVQVKFNSKNVKSWRLIGYENRALTKEDFRKDEVDAGEVGAGHAATALYEIKLQDGADGEFATVYLRYKDPDRQDVVTEQNETISVADVRAAFEETTAGFRLAAAAAQFAEILRGNAGEPGAALETLYALAAEVSGEIRTNESAEELRKAVESAWNLTLKEKEKKENQDSGDSAASR